MRAVFRIFNRCFTDGEWFVTTTVPVDFARSLQLHDMISTSVLLSFREFNCEDFIITLNEKERADFLALVEDYKEKYKKTEEQSKTEVFRDWLNDWNLTVTARKWFKHSRQNDFYLEFWIEDK